MKAVRQISLAMGVHSRRIDRESGLTVPQLIVLTCVRDLGEVTSRSISVAAHLSPPTVGGILDKLETKGFIERYRSERDRRIVHTRLTQSGKDALSAAPSLIGDGFKAGFRAMDAARRSEAITVLQTIAGFALSDHAKVNTDMVQPGHDPPLTTDPENLTKTIPTEAT